MRYFITLVCLVLADLASVEAFFPYQITHNTTPSKEESMANFIHKGFTFAGAAGNKIQQAKMTIKKRAVPLETRPAQRSASEIYHRHARLHASNPSNVVRDDQFDVASAPAPSQTNSLTILEDGTDFSYFATVTFGSNNKEVQLLLDSGAANTWVMGSDCTTQSCKTHTTYGPSDSSTLKSLDKTFQLTYGSGSVSGELVTDDMSFAGHTISLTFGTASTTSDTFEHYPMDGILGLGRDKSNTAAVGDTFMETVAAAKIIPAKQFGMSLQRESDGSMYGEINFGAPDTSQYDGDLQFTDTVADGHYWEIPCDDVLIDGKSATLTGNTAIIDSGTTYIIMPPADAKQLHASIPGAVAEDDSQWLLPCDIDLDIQFVFSGQKYSISPKDYVGPTVNNMCESHFVGTLAAGPDQWLVGDTFMKNVYTLFDFDQARIGFGVKGSASAPSSAAPSSPSTAPLSSTPSSSSHAAPSSAVSSAAASTTAAASSTGSSHASPTISPSSSAASSVPLILPPNLTSTATSAATGSSSSASERASTTANPDTAGIGASSGGGKREATRAGLVAGLCFCSWLFATGW